MCKKLYSENNNGIEAFARGDNKYVDKLLRLDKAGDSMLLGEIKKVLDLKFDDELFLFSGKDYLVIKKIQKPSLSERFKSLSKKIEERFKKEDLGEGVVDEAITWARK